LDLPQKYKDQLIEELSRPKKLQKISEDLFIEMERALRAVEKRFPESVKSTNKVRDVLIGKFRNRVIKNVTEFRKLSKIATSVKNVGVRDAKVKRALATIFEDNNVGIDEIFTESFGLKYDERKLGLSVDAVAEYLEDLEHEDQVASIGKSLRERLLKLANTIRRVVKG
jgi:hypothetical protein